MYREEVYRSIASEFGTGVGVATSIRVTEIAGAPHVERSPADRIRYRRLQDQWRINRIIGDSIRLNRYGLLSRKVFGLRCAHPDWSERRWYTTAWSELTGRKRKTKRYGAEV
jgi:hypothetical protein